jgi:hypothetical protein
MVWRFDAQHDDAAMIDLGRAFPGNLRERANPARTRIEPDLERQGSRQVFQEVVTKSRFEARQPVSR